MQSKRPRRKVISLKQLDKISPFKDIESRSSQNANLQSNVVNKPQIKSMQISAYKPSPIELQEKEEKLINDAPACTRSMDLVSLIAKKTIDQQQCYFQQNDPTLKILFNNFENILNTNFKYIKQQRLQSQNQNHVIYQHPDKDHFEMHKTKHYSILIQEQMAQYQAKRTFNTQENPFKPSFDSKILQIRQQISRHSEKLTKQVFDYEFGRVIEEQKSLFQSEVKDRKSRTKQYLLEMLNLVDRMGLQNNKKDEIVKMKKRLHRQKVLSGIFECGMGLQVMLFRPEHIFMID